MLENLYVRATNYLGYLTQSYAEYMQMDCIFITVITFLFTPAFDCFTGL